MQTPASRNRMAAVGTAVCVALAVALVWVMPPAPEVAAVAGLPCHGAADCPAEFPRCHQTVTGSGRCGVVCAQDADCVGGCCAVGEGRCRTAGGCTAGP